LISINSSSFSFINNILNPIKKNNNSTTMYIIEYDKAEKVIIPPIIDPIFTLLNMPRVISCTKKNIPIAIKKIFVFLPIIGTSFFSLIPTKKKQLAT